MKKPKHLRIVRNIYDDGTEFIVHGPRSGGCDEKDYCLHCTFGDIYLEMAARIVIDKCRAAKTWSIPFQSSDFGDNAGSFHEMLSYGWFRCLPKQWMVDVGTKKNEKLLRAAGFFPWRLAGFYVRRKFIDRVAKRLPFKLPTTMNVHDSQCPHTRAVTLNDNTATGCGMVDLCPDCGAMSIETGRGPKKKRWRTAPFDLKLFAPLLEVED